MMVSTIYLHKLKKLQYTGEEMCCSFNFHHQLSNRPVSLFVFDVYYIEASALNQYENKNRKQNIRNDAAHKQN